jgi:hypothetical protein
MRGEHYGNSLAVPYDLKRLESYRLAYGSARLSAEAGSDVLAHLSQLAGDAVAKCLI